MTRDTNAAGPGGGAAAAQHDGITDSVAQGVVRVEGQLLDLVDRGLARLVLALLRVARRVSLLRPRRPGVPWPGYSHALAAAALLTAEQATSARWDATASARLDAAIAAAEGRA